MNPVIYSAANKVLVDSYNGRPPEDGDFVYWDDVAVNPVRKQIKDHYIAEQERRCCYCNRIYPTGNNGVWDGEHIIPKSKAARFLFEPQNLAACCKDCNGAKGEAEVRKNPKRVSFPGKSTHYTIVHPHFDIYTEHVRWVGDAVMSLSPKGDKLVAMCNLTRFGHVKAGAKPAPPNPMLNAILGRIMDPKASRVDLEMAAAAIKEYAKTVPQD